jgi:hypothetical protein
MRAAESFRHAWFGALLLGGAAHAQAPACPAANEWPAKLRIEYDVTASRGPLSISGDSVLVFERAGNAYTIGIDTDSAGLYHARQTSRGTIDTSGLRPAEYVEARGRRTPQTTTIDWAGKTMRCSAAPDASATPLTGLQDRASLLLQLAWHQRAASSSAATIEIPVAGSRRVTPYRFGRRGNEKVKVPVGTMDAVRLEREVDDEHDKIEAWFGPGWCGLPVRIRYIDKNGGVIDHRLRAARID